ncbi:MAG TPA: stalk domain-containing protein [Armatimonadota bacterium]|nr:stalk domain-containing protein [Armatimonadota bacterium]
MTNQRRRITGAAAASLIGVTFSPLCVFAATGDVDVRISNHTSQDVLDGPNVSIQADFTSLTAHKISRLEFLVDGRVVDSESLSDPTRKGSFIFAWDTTSLSNEVHTILARAYDDQGNPGSSQLQVFVDNQAVDRMAPVLRITAPHDGQIVNGQFMIQVQGRQRSPLKAIDFIEIKLDDDLVGLINDTQGADVQYDASDLADGPHKIQAATVTKDGMRFEAPPVIVIVDKAHGNTELAPGPGAPPIGIPGSSARTTPPANVNTNPALSGGPAITSGMGTLDPSEVRGVGYPRLPGTPSHLAPGVARPAPSHLGERVAKAPHSTKSTGLFSTPRVSADHHLNQGARPPAQDPLLGILEPAPGKLLMRSFGGWYFHTSLDAQKSVEPAVPVSRRNSLPVAELPQSSSHREGQSIFRPQSSSTLPIVPEVAQPSRVIVVETSDSPKVAAAGKAPVPTPAGDHAGASILVPVPLTQIATPKNGVVARPSTPPVLIAMGMPRSYGAASTPAAITSDDAVFLPVPLILQPASPRGDQPSARIHTDAPETTAFLDGSLEQAENPKSHAGSAANAKHSMFAPAPFILMPPADTGHAKKAGARVATLPQPDHQAAEFAGFKAHQARTPAWLRIAYDNHWMNFDVQPIMVRGIPTAPFRNLFEYTGGQVSWHPKSRTVEAQNREQSIRLKIGSRQAVVNHQVVQLELPVFIRRGRTMIPVGFVRQAMNLNVEFDRRTGQIILTSRNVVAMAIK